MSLPAIDIRRVYLIARRDFLGYVRTWGFWVSFFLPFILMGLGLFASTLQINIQPTRYETILDSTAHHGAKIIERESESRRALERDLFESIGEKILSSSELEALLKAYDTDGLESAREFMDKKFPGAGERLKLPIPNRIFVPPPASTIEGLKPYLRGEKLITYKGETVALDGALHLYAQDKGVRADYWSENINSREVPTLARDYFRDQATHAYLKSGGLSVEGFETARRGSLSIESFDPTKINTGDNKSQAVTLADNIPGFVAATLAAILWFTVFSGSYMLLTSMLEEKLNKLLEMMLASTRFSEIMLGKLLGVAALTLTALLPYIITASGAAIVAILFGPADVSLGLKAAINAKMIGFFIVFLILGYVFYGAFFIAIGALAESMQDAQTLTTPIMLILTLLFMVVPIGMQNPQNPILIFASWFPLSAPFAAIMRLPADPPLWELCLSAFILFLCTIGVMWLAGRIFRFGVLSGSGVKGVKSWLGDKIFRKGRSRA